MDLLFVLNSLYNDQMAKRVDAAASPRGRRRPDRSPARRLARNPRLRPRRASGRETDAR